MISENLKQLLNYRINQEEYSARLYHAMHLWLDTRGYSGAGALYKKFEAEEYEHSHIAQEYLVGLNIQPDIQAIDAPPNDFASLHDIIYKTLEHEKKITQQCEELGRATLKEMDLKVFSIAQKYIDIQIHEIEESNNLVDMANNYGQERIGIMLLDQALGELAEKL